MSGIYKSALLVDFNFTNGKHEYIKFITQKVIIK